MYSPISVPSHLKYLHTVKWIIVDLWDPYGPGPKVRH